MKILDDTFNLEDYLKEHKISKTRGFIPDQQPVSKIDEKEFPFFQRFEELILKLKQFYLAGALRSKIESIPKEIDTASFLRDLKKKDLELTGQEKLIFALKLERMFLVLGLLGNAYINGNKKIGEKAKSTVPQPFSGIWGGIGEILGRPPILSHCLVTFFNWGLIDSEYSNKNKNIIGDEQLVLENLYLNNTFESCADEDWFYLNALSIEARAAPAVPHAILSIRFIQLNNWKELLNCLLHIKVSLQHMLIELKRLPEQCDPYLFYNRVRVCLTGWKGNSELPNGVIFEGLHNNTPTFYSGASAAQSSPFHLFDAVLGISHTSEFLKEQQMFMPKEHRACLQEIINSGLNVKKYLEQHKDEEWISQMSEVFNQTVVAMEEFRNYHIQIVTRFIVIQSKNAAEERGTGGTSLIPFLKSIRDDSSSSKN